MRVVGHDQQKLMLKNSLAPATLLLGPDGVGKQALALKAAGEHSYPPDDIFALRTPLDVLRVRDIIEWAQHAGSTSRGRVVIACLDGASSIAQDALLKVLEEPPPKVKFLLTASTPPLPTVVSRCQVIRCGLLSESQVEEVLLLLGTGPAQAREAAVVSGGSVAQALSMAGEEAGQAAEHVRKALAAASEGKRDRLAPLFRDGSWRPAHHRLLVRWAAEYMAGRQQLFSRAEAPGLTLGDARYAMIMASSLDAARPRILDRAILEAITKDTGK